MRVGALVQCGEDARGFDERNELGEQVCGDDFDAALTNGLAATTIHIWETNNTRTFDHVADVSVKAGAFEYTFEPDSLYSLTPALLMGRIDSADAFRDDKALLPSGYALRLEPSGKWELLSASYKQPTAILASGFANLGAAKWGRLELEFCGTTVTAFLNGNKLAEVESEAHARGMFGLGTEWDHIQFDNLRVEP